MTRGTKLAGGALITVVVCLAVWHVLRIPNLSARIRRHLPRVLRQYLIPKPTPSPRMASLPNVYLWAWERPEDLQFLSDKKVGVAFLAKTIYFAPQRKDDNSVRPAIAGRSADPRLSIGASAPTSRTKNVAASAPKELLSIFVRPRLQPLRINLGTPLMAVVRIESTRGALPNAYLPTSAPSPNLTRDEIVRVATEISSSAQITGVSALQIDFDATLSEHAFYRDLLIEVRKQLPPNFPLSITALASWCIGDRWLIDFPSGTIDEAVPMLFRMGTGTSEITGYLAKGNDFTVPACSTSLGLSTDEPFSRDILSGRISAGSAGPSTMRVYIFSPHAWTEADARPALSELAR